MKFTIEDSSTYLYSMNTLNPNRDSPHSFVCIFTRNPKITSAFLTWVENRDKQELKWVNFQRGLVGGKRWKKFPDARYYQVSAIFVCHGFL